MICADDYGLSPGVGRAIRALLAEGRIAATSAMAVFPDLETEIDRLRSVAPGAKLGLHLTLTRYLPLGAMPRLAPREKLPGLGQLAARAYARRIDPEEVEAEIERQRERLATAWGRQPDFIDGHEHVHALPVLRDAVLRVCARHGIEVRRIDPPQAVRPWALPAPIKATLLACLGRPLANAAGKRSANDGLLGLRDFRQADFRADFRRWLDAAGPNTIIICHPAEPDALLAERDPIVAARRAEFAYLSGPGLPEDRTRGRDAGA